jgi:hypothetical protein
MKYIGLPRPSYPLGPILERTYTGRCDFESNIQEKDAPSRVLRWINRIADNQIEGFGRERQMPNWLISDSHAGYNFPG